MNDELRHQLAALLGWQETDNGWITPDGDFYCWHDGYCLENRGRRRVTSPRPRGEYSPQANSRPSTLEIPNKVGPLYYEPLYY